VTGCPPDKNSYIWIPNTFTPNNDGLNDVWTPVFKNKKIILLRIFDRWGQCVFTGTEVNQYKWDGTFKGLACEQGVYAFLIIYQNEKPANTSKATTLSGHINLIRE
ncbi:MAG: gliding motility-associated C-terminal domain-containing protein, partial [Anaerolineae bacterium]|nr:gliding motility-associated C-terminal domain-containing protein [Anaerolineae bacterium]